jgi:hypothetical protein
MCCELQQGFAPFGAGGSEGKLLATSMGRTGLHMRLNRMYDFIRLHYRFGG